MLKLFYFTLCALFALTGSALAYIEPATTNILIQVIAGVFAAGGAVLCVYWKRIQLFFRKRKQKKLDAERAAELRADAAQEAPGEAIQSAAEAAEQAEQAVEEAAEQAEEKTL